MPYRYIKPLVRDKLLTYEAFRDQWENSNLHLTDLDGLLQYRMVVPARPEGSEFDGLAELQFSRLDVVHRALEMNDGDNTLFAQLQTRSTPDIFGEEVVEKDGVDGSTAGLYKHSAFLNRMDSMSHEDFFTYWADKHAPIARDVPSVVRYVRVIPPDSERAVFDGVAELYFESLGDLRGVLGGESSRDYNPGDPKARALREMQKFFTRSTVHGSL